MQESPAYVLHKLVFTLDRGADKMLQERFGISHKRALFLVMLQQNPMTQHQLAVALGYTDPAVSSMLIQLVKEGYVRITPSPDHLRKKIVSLTPVGEVLVGQARQLLDTSFAGLLKAAGVNGTRYKQQTEQIYQALSAKKER